MFLFNYPDRTKITILKLLMFIFVLLAVAVFLSILWYLRPGSWQTCLVFLIADGMFLPFSLSFLFDFIFRERLAPF